MSAPGDRPLRILCVDDNEMVATALGRRLAIEPGVEWVGVVFNGIEAYERILEARPDLVLMDIDMPEIDVFAVVAQLAQVAPGIRVVMLSGHVDVELIERAIDGGAWGYLSKNDDIPELVECMRRAARGEIAFSREVEAVHRGALRRNSAG